MQIRDLYLLEEVEEAYTLGNLLNKRCSGEHLYSCSTRISYLDMQTKKTVNGRSSRELASPKVSRYQKGAKSTQFQANKATDLITSSARKQKSGVSRLNQNGNYVGYTDLDSRFQVDDDASIECMEQNTEQGKSTLMVDNKGVYHL
ncbi:hypothetical protein Leryth_008098 [Lithospermum erythrorhizon]|nr:hypothetical protein Leryth_008098 [Lithospermum erythrorhizon]